MKNVLITGGNKGIGLETTRLFLENKEEYNVFVAARDFSGFNLEGVTNVAVDLSNLDEISNLISQVPHVDILVNNAGMMNSLPIDKYTSTAREYIMNLNLVVPVELIKYYSKGMAEKKSGRIVNVGSIASHIGHMDIWYGISKAGIVNATKSIARIYGSHGIVINAVAPGPVDTAMLEVIPEERVETLKKGSILGRVAKPEEIAKTIFWLAAESPDYINGTTIDINNGMYLR